MNKDSKIYIAGHRGLVGSALVRKLQEMGFSPQTSPLSPRNSVLSPQTSDLNLLSPQPSPLSPESTQPSPLSPEFVQSSSLSPSPSPLSPQSLVLRTHAELDLTNQAAVNGFFEQEKPDYVFLAAAKVGGILANNTYPADFIYQNLAIQTNIIHAAYKNQVKRLLFLGSSCIYPRDCPQPIKEEYLLTGPLEPTNRPYALAKIAGIEMCWSYNRQYGTQYLAVMPTNLYGPGDNYHLANSHVIPAMIRKFHLAKLAQQGDLAGIMHDEAVHGIIPNDVREMLGLSPQSSSLSPAVESSPLSPRPSSSLIPQSSVLSPRNSMTLWGTGTPRREFLYSEDMADACVYLMNLSDEDFNSVLSPQPSALNSSPFSPQSPVLNLLSPEFIQSSVQSGMPPLINIGCGEDLTIRELAVLVAEVVGFKGSLTFDTSKPDGPMRKVIDVSRIKALGWRRTMPLLCPIRTC